VRVVCPYVLAGEPGVERGLHPLCEQALARFAPDAEMHYLGTRPDAYRELLEECWAQGESFLLVEHDIEIHERVVSELQACQEPWCAFPYAIGAPGGDLIDSSLGATRFSAALLEALPGLIGSLPVRDWRRLDCEIAPRLRSAGFAPHVHSPPVSHHHVYPAPGRPDGEWCACGTEHD
jgi:hypothetical protein